MMNPPPAKTRAMTDTMMIPAPYLTCFAGLLLRLYAIQMISTPRMSTTIPQH
jgi:hypothetical protein